MRRRRKRRERLNWRSKQKEQNRIGEPKYRKVNERKGCRKRNKRTKNSRTKSEPIVQEK